MLREDLFYNEPDQEEPEEDKEPITPTEGPM